MNKPIDELDPSWVKFTIERVAKLEDALRELLKGGDHEGECTYEAGASGIESGHCPCFKHLEVSEQREAAARKLLEGI